MIGSFTGFERTHHETEIDDDPKTQSLRLHHARTLPAGLSPCFFPEVGIQAPAGTVKSDERPDEAIWGEVYEETGLSGFIEVYFRGEQIRDMRDFNSDEIHLRRMGD